MEIRMTSEVSLQEAEDMILACGNENAIHLVGEPGVGKTAMFERVVDRTGFKGVYMDVPNLELGEVGIPMPNHETKTTSLYPNDAWGFHKSEPMVIFLDEFTKPSSQAVQNTLHPLLNERRIANFKLHPDSIVITAGNNSSDGVGDNLKAHSLNRITVMPVRKPTAEEWLDWGSQNGVAPEMLAWVKAYPHAMASYLDPSQADNPYIFNPKFPKRSSAALCIMAYGAIQRIDRANIGKWFTYLKRTPTELQSVFCLSATKHTEKKQVLMTSGAFVDWRREHQYLF